MFQNFTSVSKDILFKKWQHEKVRMYLKRVFVKVPILKKKISKVLLSMQR